MENAMEEDQPVETSPIMSNPVETIPIMSNRNDDDRTTYLSEGTRRELIAAAILGGLVAKTTIHTVSEYAVIDKAFTLAEMVMEVSRNRVLP